MKSAETKAPLSTGLFIPDGKEFIELTDLVGMQTSGNEVGRYLGYTAEQIDIHYGNPEKSGGIKAVALELFTEKVIYVYTDDQLTTVTRQQVEGFLQTFRAPLHALQIEDQLREGIANRSLPTTFFERVFGLTTIEPGAIIDVPKIGYILFFNDGYLDSFQSSNGLNADSKFIQGYAPALVARREKEARLFWGNQPGKVLSEVNQQMSAYMQLPFQRDNPFIDFHRTPYDTVNYVLLMVCHYEMPITLEEFTQLNHGRYKTLSDLDDELRIFTVGRFRYEFFASGGLFQVVQLA